MQENEMPYSELLRVGWLLIWRGLLVPLTGAIFGFIVGFTFKMFGIPGTRPVSAVGGLLLGIFLITPLVVRMMMRKRFRGFHLQIKRESSIVQL